MGAKGQFASRQRERQRQDDELGGEQCARGAKAAVEIPNRRGGRHRQVVVQRVRRRQERANDGERGGARRDPAAASAPDNDGDADRDRRLRRQCDGGWGAGRAQTPATVGISRSTIGMRE